MLPLNKFLNVVQFIADIRGARVRELEEKRINKEMANIRKRFKGKSCVIHTGALTHIPIGRW